MIGYSGHAERLKNIIENFQFCKINYIFHPSKHIDDSRGTKNFSDLLRCDAIIIASPNNTHYEYIEKLVGRFNGFLLCEKPPVTSREHLEKLKNLSNGTKSHIFFNFNYRFSKLSDIIKNSLTSKDVGKITHFNIISTHGLAFKEKYKGSWRADGKINLHSLLETVSIHYLDLLTYHLGKIKKSFYIPNLISGNGESYDSAHLVLEFKTGVTASIFNSYAAPYLDEISIIGTNGLTIIRENNFKIYSPRNTFNSEGFFITPPVIKETRFLMDEDYKNSLTKSLEYFFSHVKNNKNIDLNHFNSSIDSNSLILDLKVNKITNR